MTWRALLAMLRKPWQDSEHLLALLVDVNRLLLWAKTEDGSKGRNQPAPIPRPGQPAPGRRDAEIVAAAKQMGW